ncbi:MAG: 3-dehydroquinate synthase [Candidatus Acidiferrales bacterium]
MPKTCIRSNAGPYDVYCAAGVLKRAGSLVASLPHASAIFVLSSPRVWANWGRSVTRILRRGAKGLRITTILFDDSESAKDLQTIELIVRELSRAGADRRAVIVALGGGVVGDVAGFAAASYLRGVRLVHIPTTLVAQVDSAIGGKTGVNLPEGKNLVGAFYPPKVVVVDPLTLATLPHREYRSGLFEVIKYGVIADPELFAFLEKRMLALLRRDSAALAWVIARCIRIKAEVVMRDEREGSLREILNFGHTLGHGFEAATAYKRFLHGEAIGWGMYAATLFALATERLSEAQAIRVIRLIASVGPLPPLTGIRAAALKRLLSADKKSRSGRVRWVLPRRIAKVEWGVELPWNLVVRALNELPAIAAKAAR